MSGPLYIQPGSPHWWLSPAIWVTPVGDPTTKVTNPVAGQDYTVWVQVENKYSAPVDGGWNLFVCWAIPTAGDILVSSIASEQILNGVISMAGPQGLPITIPIPGGGATPAVVTLQAATTWTPSYDQNHNGHECLIAMAYLEQATGLPVSTLNGDAPWQQTYSIAQHNLGVLPARRHLKHLFHYPFQICNAEPEERGFVVEVTQAPLSEIAAFLPGVSDGRKLLDRPGKAEHLGLLPGTHADPAESHASSATLSTVNVAPRSCRAFTLTGRLAEGNALIHVTQRLDERVIGGLSVLVMAEET